MEEKTFCELTETLTVNQQDFLGLLVYGFNARRAETMMGLSGSNATVWRRDEKFAEIEIYLTSNLDKYYPQVRQHFAKRVEVLDYAVFRIAEKLLKWDELDDKEKGRVWNAYTFIRKAPPKDKDEGDYEHRLMGDGNAV